MLYFVREMDQAMGRIRTMVRKEPMHPMARSNKQNVEKSIECMWEAYRALTKPMLISELSRETGFSETSCKKYMSILLEDKKVVRNKYGRGFYYMRKL